MRSFKNYALGAALFAVIATIACLASGLSATLMDFSAFSFLPIMTGFFISGNVHALSEFGLYLGVLINWLIVALPFALIIWLAKWGKDGVAT